ncbi:MAG: FAD-dependent oxidoreductase, partial [Polaromonas sp.]
HVFKQKRASCLVNPRACHETELVYRPTAAKKRIAVVGAGPAGLACATVLAERGHSVDLFDAAAEIGGQFNMAKQIPGKEEFFETLRYFKRRIEITGVNLHLNQQVTAEVLGEGKFDEVFLATGVTPRDPKIPGQDMPHVLSYIDVLRDKKPVGKRVAVVGAGGIGFDVAEFLVDEGHSPALDNGLWMKEWGVVDPSIARGGVAKPEVSAPARTVTLLQRKATTVGKGLGKTTGWIHRAALKMKNVEMLSGVNYERIGEEAGGLGLFITFGEKRQDGTVLAVDNIVLCAGQEPLRELLEPLRAAGVKTHLIGGADEATELDAKRAIDQGTRLAAAM